VLPVPLPTQLCCVHALRRATNALGRWSDIAMESGEGCRPWTGSLAEFNNRSSFASYEVSDAKLQDSRWRVGRCTDSSRLLRMTRSRWRCVYPGILTTCLKQHMLCETSARQAEDALVLSAKKSKIANKHVVDVVACAK
jgi:hypothetical protein